MQKNNLSMKVGTLEIFQVSDLFISSPEPKKEPRFKLEFGPDFQTKISAQYGGSNKVALLEQKDILRYIVSILSTHNNLLSHNRRFFLGLSIGLFGFGFVEFVQLSFSDFSCVLVSGLKTAMFLASISIAGLFSNYFWKVTTYFRAHQVYFLTAILDHIELGAKFKPGLAAPMTLVSRNNSDELTAVLKRSKRHDPIVEEVVRCEARDTFRKLRLFFLLGWCVFGSFAVSIASVEYFGIVQASLIGLTMLLNSCFYVAKQPENSLSNK